MIVYISGYNYGLIKPVRNYTITHSTSSIPPYITPHHSTPLHFAPLHFTALRSTPSHCTAIRSTPSHCTPLRSTPSHCTALHSNSTPLHTTPRHPTPLHTTPLHSAPPHSTPLHSTRAPLHSTPLHSTPLHSTPLHSSSTPLQKQEYCDYKLLLLQAKAPIGKAVVNTLLPAVLHFSVLKKYSGNRLLCTGSPKLPSYRNSWVLMAVVWSFYSFLILLCSPYLLF